MCPKMKNINNLAIIKDNLELIKQNQLTEVRIIGTANGTVSGYFDDYKALATSLVEYTGKHDIYVTLNKLKGLPDGVTKNKLQKYARKTTSDADVERLNYVLIDIDPKRAAGISATSQEKEAAYDLMEEIIIFLETKDIGSYIKADSGNGYHVLLPIDVVNNRSNVDVLKKFLQYLDLKFSTDDVDVDLTTYNPSRIVKLYGTPSTKGEDTVDRPHRLSKIIGTSKEIEDNAFADIREIAELLPKADTKKEMQEYSNSNSKFDVDDFIERHQLDLSHKGIFHNEGQKWVLATCPWDETHTDKAAYIIQFNNGAVAAGCHHDGCSHENWKSLRELVGEPPIKTSEASSDKKQADQIISMAKKFQYFKDDLHEHYVAVDHEDYFDILSLDSRTFKLFLLKMYRDKHHTTPADSAINSAIQVLKAEAEFSGNQRKLEKRIAKNNDKFYYDLADDSWEVIEIDKNGARIAEDPPILFLRTKNMQKQYQPDFNAKPEELLKLVDKHFRLKTKEDELLFATYLVSSLVPDIGHPILVVHGEKGSGKSFAMRQIKSIVDPAVQELLVFPQANKDLAVSLSNNYMPVFDNMDTLSAAKSDILCQAATGGAFTSRTLFSDAEETILSFKRSIGLNGINIVATRPDLLDRSILIELERIPRDKRLTEKQLWKNFNADIPKILGAAFNALSKAMAIRDDLKLKEVGRMADFNYWGYAIAEALNIKGGGASFQEAYLGNQESANMEAIESHPIASGIINLMNSRSKWQGSVTELLEALQIIALKHGIDTKNKLWSNDANVLSRRLREIKSNLLELGISYGIRHTGSYKEITIEKKSS